MIKSNLSANLSRKPLTKVKNQKILITGGAGFIGSNITKKLIENNKITIYDNLRRNALKHTDFINHKNLSFIQGDILDFKSLNKAVKEKDIIIHLAAIAGVSSYYQNPLKTLEVDALGTYNVLKAGRLENVNQVLLFSSSEVYGNKAKNVKEEDPAVIGSPTDSRWSYATGKLIGDHFAFAFSKITGLNITIIRPFNIYGPGQVGEGAIQIFIKQALKEEPITINGDGKQKRAWCYIDDLVDGILLMINNKKAYNQIFNIGNPKAYCSINQFVNILLKIIKTKSKKVYLVNKYTDIQDRLPNIDKAIKLLKYKPKVLLNNGLNKTLLWYEKNIT